MRLKISSFVAGLICLVFGPLTSAQPQNEILDKMTVEQKVGQVMIWSFSGLEMTPEFQRTLTKYQPGALIVFRRNIKSSLQIAKLNADLQKFASVKMKAPLFLMVDQEGGLVTRVRTNTPMPSALALSKMEDADFVERYGRATAEMLSAIGFNVNLAPVLDISNPKKDSFIGNRTFGINPAEVAALTTAYSRGMSSGGIMPTAKHFPGHGGTTQDSHQMIPKKTSTLEELTQKDLVPFNEFAGASFGRALMMAHLSLPNIDPSGLPATYSSIMIQDILRVTMSYQGLVITDDLEMNGASVAKDIGERAVRAFQAGNDMLMFAGSAMNQRKAYAALLQAVKSGKITTERLNESVTRILSAKASAPAPAKFDAKKALGAFQKLDVLSKEVLKRNFKIAAETAKKEWPEATTESSATVFSASSLFFHKFRAKFKGRAKFYAMSPESLENVRSELAAGRSDYAVFFASGIKTARWLNKLPTAEKAKLIVVNCMHFGEIENQNEFLSVLNINSYFTDSGRWLAELINEPQDLRTPATQLPASAFPMENEDLRLDHDMPANPEG